MSEPAPAQVEAPVPQDSATSVAAEPAAEGGAEGQSKKAAKKVRRASGTIQHASVSQPRDRRAGSARDPASRGRGLTRTRDRAAHLDVIERPPPPRAGSRTRDDPRARPARPPPPRPGTTRE